jgi:hypothetical protein
LSGTQCALLEVIGQGHDLDVKAQQFPGLQGIDYRTGPAATAADQADLEALARTLLRRAQNQGSAQGHRGPYEFASRGLQGLAHGSVLRWLVVR